MSDRGRIAEASTTVVHVSRRDKVPGATRADAVRAAVASARLAGATLSAPTLAVFDDYVAGAIDADEMIWRVLRMHGPDANPSTPMEHPAGSARPSSARGTA